MTPHSKSEAKRLAVQGREFGEVSISMKLPTTWFAQCACPGDTQSQGANLPFCVACDTVYCPVPHVVEDRIRADERKRGSVHPSHMPTIIDLLETQVTSAREALRMAGVDERETDAEIGEDLDTDDLIGMVDAARAALR